MNVKVAVLCAVVMMTRGTLTAADVFYEQRFEAGRVALAAKKPLEAADQLRIAAFGLLDEPKRLSQALAMLTVAEAALGRSAETENALLRFVELERQFPSYDGNALDPVVRPQFEAILIRSVPKATLTAVPSLARLLAPAAPARPPTQRPPTQPATTQSAAAQPVPTRPAPQPAVTTPSPAPATTTVVSQPSTTRPPPPQTSNAQPQSQPATSRSSAQSPTPQTAKAPSAAQPPSTQPAAPKRARTTDESLADAQGLLKANRPSEAIVILNEAVTRDPGRRELRLLLLQGAILTKNWPLASVQVKAVEPFFDAEPVSMFYGAVALYESGRLTEARALLQRALPRIARSAYVDQYTSRILGSRTSS